MNRLTKRISENVYYTLGKYPETIPAECEPADVRTILRALAAYEDAEEQGRLVKVTRCGECVFWDRNITGYGSEHPCRLHSSEVMTCYKQPEQYCSSGEAALDKLAEE